MENQTQRKQKEWMPTNKHRNTAGYKGLVNVTRTGRNDACPCGKKDSNGKSVKFKNCCMEQDG